MGLENKFSAAISFCYNCSREKRKYLGPVPEVLRVLISLQAFRSEPFRRRVLLLVRISCFPDAVSRPPRQTLIKEGHRIGARVKR